MNDIWQKMNDVLEDYLFDIGDIMITPETRLGEIPDWDSIAAVSLQMLLHETFDVDLPLDLFHENTTFSELVALMEQPDRISEVVRMLRERN